MTVPAGALMSFGSMLYSISETSIGAPVAAPVVGVIEVSGGPLVGVAVSIGGGRIVTWPSLRVLLERFWSVTRNAVAETVIASVANVRLAVQLHINPLARVSLFPFDLRGKTPAVQLHSFGQ